MPQYTVMQKSTVHYLAISIGVLYEHQILSLFERDSWPHHNYIIDSAYSRLFLTEMENVLSLLLYHQCGNMYAVLWYVSRLCDIDVSGATFRSVLTSISRSGHIQWEKEYCGITLLKASIHLWYWIYILRWKKSEHCLILSFWKTTM